MKTYLYSLGVWYGMTALLMTFSPDSIITLPRLQSILSYDPRGIFAVAYFLSAALCIAAAIGYNARIRLAAQAVALALACSWTVLLFIAAIWAGSGYGGSFVWLWVILVQAGSVRYYDIPPIIETQATEHFKQLMLEARTKARARSGPISPDEDGGQ